MPERAAGSGGFTLEVPVDASAISASDLKQQNLKIVVKTCEGELSSQPVKLKADGTGSASFSFAKSPGPVHVLIGPDRAEDAELADSQTITSVVPQSMWAAKRQLVLEPIVVSYWWWSWWWRWCREFTIHGRVVCPDGRPVPGAEVCAYDVDWFWWWWTKQQVGCAFTDINGSFDISFRWCCGYWPWWWWRYRIWEFQPEIAQAIVPVLERDPRIELGNTSNVPSLEVFKPLLRGLDTSKPLASVPAGQLDEIRASLLEKLPAAPELATQRIWPWWPWWPWWDCTPDIIFKVTQDCLLPGTVIVNEGYGDTRWDIPDPLNVTLVANRLACCKPIPPCVEGDCIEISAFCSEEYLALSDVGGNPGAPVGRPDGYAPGDRPFSETIGVYKANTFVGVDYYEIEYWNTGVGDWTDLPAGACEDFCRYWLQPIFPFPQGAVKFKWETRVDSVLKSHLVVESREHHEAVSPLPPAAFWEISSQLVVPLDTMKFPDGTYKFRVVGWTDDGVGKVKNGHVLKVCETDIDNEWMLTFDNRINPPDPSVLNCGPPTVRICTKEPRAVLNSITIDGNPIPACGVTEIKGNLLVDFEASDIDGHLSHYALTIHYGAGLEANLLTLPGAVLTRVTGDGEGPTYGDALLQPWGAAVPTWHGGRMTLSVPASEAFPEPCCYLIRLEAWKRHVLGSTYGTCGYTCDQDQYYNEDEFTVGAGVCDPRVDIALPSVAAIAAAAPEAG